MKVLAMYLPQFHKVKENDEWWGEGFTDWISAKNALPLFEGHYQPHMPFNDNYYDLLNKQTMMWQNELMKKYGIDGICMYHYWFKDGRQILEKPAEQLLMWKDIDIPYCFCWANETWARSWAKIQEANTWADLYENVEERNRNGNAILLEQRYGDKEEWKKHFVYLNQFFMDERYIKIDGKPLFIIYKSSSILCLDEMITVWQQCAKEFGWKGLYIIGGHYNGNGRNTLDSVMICEPGNEVANLRYDMQKDGVECIDYTKLWECILENNQYDKLRTYYCGVVGYDDTPRRGKKGRVFVNNTPQIFADYMTKLMAKSSNEGNDIVFLNAWNEWGEGMHLEPDKKHGYAYLEAVNYAKENYHNNKYDYSFKEETLKNRMLMERAEKSEMYMNTLDNWLKLMENDINIANYLMQKNYINIGVYGYGILGRHFIDEIKKSDISIDFLIDKQKNRIDIDLPVFLPDEQIPTHDIIIVTSFYYFNEIKEELPEYCKLLSLQEIIYSLAKNC